MNQYVYAGILRIVYRVAVIAAIGAAGCAYAAAGKVALTAEEQQWLVDHPRILVAPDPDFPPVEWLDSANGLHGIAADFLGLVQRRSGIRFETVRCANWDDVLQRAREKRVDMLSAAGQTPQRSEYLLFSTPHIVLPGVIITRKDARTALSMKELRGKTVAVVSGYVWQEFIQRDYPGIVLDLVPDVQSGLEKVSFGHDDAFIENLATAIYYIEKRGITNLRVTGETGYFTRLSFAVRNDWQPLQQILSKTLASIGPAERDAVLKKWIRLDTRQSVFAYTTFWFAFGGTVAVALAIILLMVAWSHSLRRLVGQRTAALSAELAERTRVEAALRASENKFIEMVENANSIILRMSTDGVVTFFNRFAEEFFGFTREEIIGRNVVGTIVPPKDMAGTDLGAKIKNLGEQPEKYQTSENENMKKSGERVWISWSNKPIFDAGGRASELLCVGNDITRLKYTEQALKGERDFADAVFETAGALVVVIDPAGGIVRFNKTCQETTGLSVEEVTGRLFWEVLLVDEEKSRIRGVFDQLVAGAFPNQAENHWKCRDGSLRLISWHNTALTDDDGRVAFVISTGIDITERRRMELEIEKHHARTEELVRERTASLSQAVKQLEEEIAERRKVEEALRESERRYRFLFEESPAGALIMRADGIITNISTSLAESLGYSREEVIGRTATEFVVPEEREEQVARLRRRFLHQQTEQAEVRVCTRDGSTRTILFSAGQAVLRENGKQDSVLVTGIDITDRKNAEMLAWQREQDLVRADKLSSLGTLVSGVAHEINNPNNFIILNAGNIRDVWASATPILDNTYDGGERFDLAGIDYREARGDIPRLIQGIIEGAERIRVIVGNLKDFVRPESPAMNQPVDLNRVIEASQVILANMIKKSTDRFEVSLPRQAPVCLGNFQKLEQVVINLIANACQALPDKSRAIRVSTWSNGKEVAVEVSDEGTGIAPEYLAKVFDPFFTTKRDSGGTGLGLSISYSIAREHKGDLTISSVVGRGTVVRLILPAAEPQQGDPA